MNKRLFLISIFAFSLITSEAVFAQNIELPDLTTIISGETIQAGADALPDFKDVMILKEGSGNVVPVLPDVDTPTDYDENIQTAGQTEKTIFAEGLIGGGYPTVFTGNFSVFKLSEQSPFKVSFAHDSAVGYGNHSLSDGYNDKNTSLFVEKGFSKNQFDVKVSGAYQSLSNGLQKHFPGVTGLNQDNYSGKIDFLWSITDIFSAGLVTDIDFYNRYADIATGDFPSVSVMDVAPQLFLQWNVNDFEIDFTSVYSFESDFKNVISKESVHRGDFSLGLQWQNDIIKAYGRASAVVGNQMNDNSIIVPFNAGIDATFPVYFSNRRFGISAEGGLQSSMSKIMELEKKYKFAILDLIPQEITDWYGKISFSVPLKESFTGTALFEYRGTAFGNGYYQPDYSTDSKIYGYKKTDLQQFISDFSLTYHYKRFSISGQLHSNWLDIPVLTPAHQVSMDLNFQDEESRWGTSLIGIMNIDTNPSSPIINFEGFARLTSSVRAVLNVQDALNLFTNEERVYAGDYISRGGTVTALLKFFF